MSEKRPDDEYSALYRAKPSLARGAVWDIVNPKPWDNPTASEDALAVAADLVWSYAGTTAHQTGESEQACIDSTIELLRKLIARRISDNYEIHRRLAENKRA